jgi:acyl-CoA synthetase (AMP-forming)/AMP-acid ligase II
MHLGWLRTGDLGYLDEDYYLYLVDRKKRLILVNGLNVYPTQIEQVIMKHPAVVECIVISVPDSRSGEAAKAFIRLKRDAQHQMTEVQMKEFLSQNLGRFEIPKFIEFVDEELPKTTVGKPDWRGLQEQERQKGSIAFGDSDLDMEQAL